MATNYTTNYELNQWRSTDQVLRTDFNADNAKIDAALAGKAETETETVSALQAAVAGKAEQADLSALEAQVNSMGIAKAEGTYTGDGGTQQAITTGFRPALVILFNLGSDLGNSNLVFLLGTDAAQFVSTRYNNRYISTTRLSFIDTGFLVQTTLENTDFNYSGRPYRYVAIR